MTWMNMCEVISWGFKDFWGKDITPEEIWGSSNTGELAHILAWFDATVCTYRVYGDSPTE